MLRNLYLLYDDVPHTDLNRAVGNIFTDHRFVFYYWCNIKFAIAKILLCASQYILATSYVCNGLSLTARD